MNNSITNKNFILISWWFSTPNLNTILVTVKRELSHKHAISSGKPHSNSTDFLQPDAAGSPKQYRIFYFYGFVVVEM